MLIKRLRIRNFRSIRALDLDLGETTVFIGPNNTGKTAILDALRIALTRRWGQRGTGFTEYDVHLRDEKSDPKTSDPVVIEIDLQEQQPGQWHADLQADLADIIQVDPLTGQPSILLRVSCAWDPNERAYMPRWEFLNVARTPLAGKAARAVNLQEFFQYLPVFYLDALRDADDEFSSRSQFWGRLLRTVQIPEPLERRAQRIFDLLNKKFLGADPKLGTLASTLSGVSRIAAGDEPGTADLRMVPLRPWDLLSRAEVIYRCETDKPWLPLSRHGQGIQSLSILFLFHAFVNQLLSEVYKPHSAPVLALEEPETHLHPQAARTLWRYVSDLPGQKLVTTHSPYFLQDVPFRDLRLVRLGPQGTVLTSLPSTFAATLPHVSAVDPVVSGSGGLLRYDRSLGELTVSGALEETRYRALLTAYASHSNQAEVQWVLRDLRDRSYLFVSDSELEQLETFARRVRGEIFFARRWLLVEGQSEHPIAHGIGTGLGYDLDAHGVAVIDFQNNGNPACFVALARALGIPWLAIVDGDRAGRDYITQIERRGIESAEVARRCSILPAGTLEQQLIHDGLQQELKSILAELGERNALSLDDAALQSGLEKNKSAYAAILRLRCGRDPALTARMPEAFRRAIVSLRGLT